MNGDAPSERRFEHRLGRLLIVVTWVAVTLLAVGVALMLVDGISPLAGGPPLDLRLLLGNIVSLDPAGLLWLGLIAVIATPVSRVIGAGVGYGQRGEWRMVAVSVGILIVIGLGIASAGVLG